MVESELGPPAVARHLRVLRDAGFLTRRAERRLSIYALDPAALDEVEAVVVGIAHCGTSGSMRSAPRSPGTTDRAHPAIAAPFAKAGGRKR